MRRIARLTHSNVLLRRLLATAPQLPFYFYYPVRKCSSSDAASNASSLASKPRTNARAVGDKSRSLQRQHTYRLRSLLITPTGTYSCRTYWPSSCAHVPFRSTPPSCTPCLLLTSAPECSTATVHPTCCPSHSLFPVPPLWLYPLSTPLSRTFSAPEELDTPR
ncbi:hypothetical protein OUZ56_010123 [Daphnia magna]|uniref:Uncharacterized protein n=1 Tax=Daphnia magna TaxID=35525 RepID=A0ABR0AHX0_9CRUS|nr:hypothetical protein OUZ56_010123 [Daphnia magna]